MPSSKLFENKLSIAHIINPVVVPRSSDLFVAQPITFESMKRAQERTPENISVELFSAQFSEDRILVPNHLHQTPDLNKSIIDLMPEEATKKLPFIRDILDRLYDASDADVLVYSNVDIGLSSNFYASIASLILAGHDSISISRRIVPAKYSSIDDLPQIDIEEGIPLPGWDCFVFLRQLYPDFELNDVCIGAPGVDRALISNLSGLANNYICLSDHKIIFHIGNDSEWITTNTKIRQVNRQNRKNALVAIRLLREKVRDRHRNRTLNRHYNELRRKLSPWRLVGFTIYQKSLKLLKRIVHAFMYFQSIDPKNTRKEP